MQALALHCEKGRSLSSAYPAPARGAAGVNWSGPAPVWQPFAEEHRLPARPERHHSVVTRQLEVVRVVTEQFCQCWWCLSEVLEHFTWEVL